MGVGVGVEELNRNRHESVTHAVLTILWQPFGDALKNAGQLLLDLVRAAEWQIQRVVVHQTVWDCDTGLYACVHVRVRPRAHRGGVRAGKHFRLFACARVRVRVNV